MSNITMNIYAEKNQHYTYIIKFGIVVVLEPLVLCFFLLQVVDIEASSKSVPHRRQKYDPPISRGGSCV